MELSEDEDFEPVVAAVGAPTDKWDGEDSDDDKIKDAWDAAVSQVLKCLAPGNTKGGCITALLTSCLTGLESAV